MLKSIFSSRNIHNINEQSKLPEDDENDTFEELSDVKSVSTRALDYYNFRSLIFHLVLQILIPWR